MQKESDKKILRLKTDFALHPLPLETENKEEEEHPLHHPIQFETMIEQLNENIDQMNIQLPKSPPKPLAEVLKE